MKDKVCKCENCKQELNVYMFQNNIGEGRAVRQDVYLCSNNDCDKYGEVFI